MKTALTAVSVVSTLFLLAACETETRSPSNSGTRTGHTGEVPVPSPAPVVEAATPTPAPTDPGATPTPEPTPTPTPATSNIPYGTPVPGKPGFVISPYSSEGYVDVQGIPPNTEVRDPFTNKIFRVP
jgi:hypothetical protein